MKYVIETHDMILLANMTSSITVYNYDTMAVFCKKIVLMGFQLLSIKRNFILIHDNRTNLYNCVYIQEFISITTKIIFLAIVIIIISFRLVILF